MVSQIRNPEFKEFWDEEMKKKVVIDKVHIDKLYNCYHNAIGLPRLTMSDNRLVKTFDFSLDALKSESAWWKS